MKVILQNTLSIMKRYFQFSKFLENISSRYTFSLNSKFSNNLESVFVSFNLNAKILKLEKMFFNVESNFSKDIFIICFFKRHFYIHVAKTKLDLGIFLNNFYLRNIFFLF